MLKKLLDLRIILGVVLVISWGLAVLFYFKFKENNEEQLALKDSEISSLQQQIADIGELMPAYCVSTDVVSGKQIEETDLEYIEVPLSMSTNLVMDTSELVGKYFKLAKTAGSVITYDDVYEEVITDDMRYYDLMVDVLPVGLEPGSFVDIRIRFGTGADYVGVVHRQVAEINGHCLKLILTENDILTFSSMLIDNLVFAERITATVDLNNDGEINGLDFIAPIGCYLYAIEYVEGGLQPSAVTYYSPSVVVQSLMLNDPNLLETSLSPEDMLLRRNLIKAGLLPDEQDEMSVVYTDRITSYVSQHIQTAQQEYERRMEREQQAAVEDDW